MSIFQMNILKQMLDSGRSKKKTYWGFHRSLELLRKKMKTGPIRHVGSAGVKRQSFLSFDLAGLRY